MSRICPDCASALRPKAYGNLDLDACEACGGLYFDEGELVRLQNAGPEALAALEDEVIPTGLVLLGSVPGRNCPGCGGRMCEYRYRYHSEIRLDGCEVCNGIWVQEGELRQVVEHLGTPEAGSAYAQLRLDGVNASGRMTAERIALRMMQRAHTLTAN